MSEDFNMISTLLFCLLGGQIISPYDDKIPGNPVGMLQELCVSRYWPFPRYKIVKEEGVPHQPIFTVYCFPLKHQETGYLEAWGPLSLGVLCLGMCQHLSISQCTKRGRK
jgi:hypothetical protein